LSTKASPSSSLDSPPMHGSRAPRALPSFPTRRSSDLDRTVPDLINKEYEDVVDVLEGQNLRTERAYMYSDEIDEGYVAKTSPKAGKVIKEDSVVTVYVSQGKEKITMNDYSDKDFDNVEKELLEMGFNNIIPYEKYSDEPKGEILKQIQPTPGNEVVPSETTVIM